ncbi:MAG: DUF5723 family protein [Chitinophagales bacterium]|nr:DUF5723 family protein [Chitinophagales bacterium]MDW8392983.1 DUF5723 family protein [Chitinophagales bacterium]
MKTIRQQLIGIGLGLLPATAVAQVDQGLISFNPMPVETSIALARDYQSAGINPANLGLYPMDHEVPIVTLGLLEASGMFYSDALPKSDLLPSLFRGETLSADERRSLAQQFATNGHVMSTSILPLGICVQFPRFLGVSFTWQERFTGNAVLSEPFADLLFNGLESAYIDSVFVGVTNDLIGIADTSYNFYELFNGSQIQYNWLRDYTISAGRQLFAGGAISLYAGGAVKFVQSNALADVQIQDDTVTGFAAFSSLFDINYGNLTDPDVQLGGRFAPVGKGMGFDVGLTLRLGRSLLLSGAVTDIGRMSYTGNLVTVTQTLTDSLINYLGLNYATVFSDLETIFNAKGLFRYLPEANYETTLPTMLRLGAGWYMSSDVRLGLNVVVPVNDAVAYWSEPRLSATLDMRVVPAVKLSAGLKLDGREVLNIPAGIVFTFTPREIWQLGFGTGDVISLVRQDRPTLSLRLALSRFQFH